jgi:hypothetical protein
MPLSRYAACGSAALLSTVLAIAPARAQVQVSLRPLAPPEAFYLADLLPGASAARPDLLSITLVAGVPTGYLASVARAGQSISLELILARESPAPAEIFRGTTNPFELTQPVLHLTTRDLVTRGGATAITDFHVNQEALSGTGGRAGRLPAGDYLVTVNVRDANGNLVDSDELRLSLTSASRVELLSPGAPADLPPPEVMGPTPRFLWSAVGGAPDARYRLRVVRVDEGGSAVEALQSGFPAWDAVVQGTSAFYPASAQALRLQPGATYAWQVNRLVASSGGEEVVESPIYWFRVGGPGGVDNTPGGLGLRWAALLRALGLAGLEGFTPVGATLDDGRVLPLDRLEALLAAIEAGEVAVLSVQVR